jgi:hypothetical protein
VEHVIIGGLDARKSSPTDEFRPVFNAARLLRQTDPLLQTFDGAFSSPALCSARAELSSSKDLRAIFSTIRKDCSRSTKKQRLTGNHCRIHVFPLSEENDVQACSRRQLSGPLYIPGRREEKEDIINQRCRCLTNSTALHMRTCAGLVARCNGASLRVTSSIFFIEL